MLVKGAKISGTPTISDYERRIPISAAAAVELSRGRRLRNASWGKKEASQGGGVHVALD